MNKDSKIDVCYEVSNRGGVLSKDHVSECETKSERNVSNDLGSEAIRSHRGIVGVWLKELPFKGWLRKSVLYACWMLIWSDGVKDLAGATWVGNTSNDMGIATNWGTGLPTLAGDSFIFGAAGTGGTLLNNTLTNQIINSSSITFNAGAPGYTLTGNALIIGATATVPIINNSSNLQTINLPLNLAQNMTFSGGAGITVGGTIGLGGTADNRTIRNDLSAGILTLGGVISLADASARTWTFGGTSLNRTVISGVIQNGGAGAGGLTVNHLNRAGGISLSAANTYTGTTTASFGTLNLDFAAASVADNIINSVTNSSGLSLGGGTLSVTGKPGVSNSQRFASTTLVLGRSSAFRVVQNGAAGVSVTLGSLTRNDGSLIDFSLPSAGAITTTTTLATGANNVLTSSANVAYASVDGTSWATNSGGTIGALAGGLYQTDFSVPTGDTDVVANSSPGVFVANTLRFNTGNTALTLAAGGASTVTTGGILVTPAGVGSSIVSGGAGAGLGVGSGKELMVINNTTGAAGFTISAPIVDTSFSSATFGGLGVTYLRGANTYTVATRISGGVLDVGLVTSSNLSSAGILMYNGGVLQGNGVFTRGVNPSTSTSGVAAAGQVLTANGGFAARGGR